MFGKKKKQPEVVKKELNFTEWEKDLGFLTLILSRKKGITKEFLIGILSRQQQDKDYLKDEDIEKAIYSIVSDTITKIGPEYKNFLIEKYFGSLENLVSFITEDVYVDLISDAINRNSVRIKANIQKDILNKLNKKVSKVSSTKKKEKNKK